MTSVRYSSADIGDLFGITASAVNMWRKRHRDFPSPVGILPGKGKANYWTDLNEIEEWHKSNIAPQPIVDRILAKMVWSETKYLDTRTGITTRCLLWTGKRHPGGYGVLDDLLTHRWLYQHWIGPVDPDAVLDHRCHSDSKCDKVGIECPHTPCGNPAHLEPLSREEHSLRSHGRHKESCINGHALTAENLYVKPGTEWWQCRICRAAASRRRRERRRDELSGAIKRT